jgi:hypothetical protein
MSSTDTKSPDRKPSSNSDLPVAYRTRHGSQSYLEWLLCSLEAEEPLFPMNLDKMLGNCSCFGLTDAVGVGLLGGEVSGLDAIGDNGLLKKNLVDLLGVREGSGCKGPAASEDVVGSLL